MTRKVNMDATVDTATETYLDVEHILDSMARSFCRRYGGECDEIRGTLNEWYMLAVRDHVPQKCHFIPYLRHSLRFRLLSLLRQRIVRRRHKQFVKIEDESEEVLAREHAQFRFTEFLDELSEDARTVVDLVLHCPKVLENEIVKRGNEPRNVKAVLREYLRYLGWTTARVSDTYHEIERALRT